MKRILLLNLFVFVGLSMGFSQTSYFAEDFEAGVPAGWSATGEWMHGDAATLSSQYANFTTGTNMSNFMAFNDDAQGNMHQGGGRVTTGPIDLTAVTGAAWLEIEYWFLNGDFDGADETAMVSISRDAGATWELIRDLPGNGGWSYIPLDISSYVGETIQLAFDYDDGGGWNYFFCLDNVGVSDVPVNSERRSYTFSINGGSQFNQVLQDIDYEVAGVVTNSGYETITSFDVTVTEGTETETYSFDGYNIALGEAARYELPTTIKADAFKLLTLAVANVNGEEAPDVDVANNTANLVLSPVSVHPDKAVLVEEATGTWCTWCPRGTVYMDEMKKRFGEHFAGIAVHNSDPMALPEHDSGVGAFPGFSGYPSVVYNRASIQDPSDIVTPSISDMSTAPVAKLEVGVDLDGILMSTRLSVSFLEDATDNFKVLVILTEDGLQSDEAGWNQVSGAYSGGGQGPMGGFEYLPSSVPAAVWPYDHVSRAILGGFGGTGGVITGAFAAGDGDSYIFPDFVVNTDWNTDEMHIVGVLLDGGGRVINAVSSKFNDAVARGTTGVEDELQIRYLDVYPNPVSNNATISLALDVTRSVQATLVNALGQKVSSVSYGELFGNQKLDFDMSEVNPGVYYLNIVIDGEVISKRLMKS